MTEWKRKLGKFLWDEYRETKLVRQGSWWLVEEPDPPDWFWRSELGWDTRDDLE